MEDRTAALEAIADSLGKPDFYVPKPKPDLQSGRFKKLSDLNAMPMPPAGPTSGNGASSGDFKPGQRVRHAKFGTGTIKSIEGEGANCKLIVAFDTPGIGEKTLLTKFAKVEVI